MKNLSLLFIAFLLLQPTTLAQQASIWDQVPEEVRKTNPFKRFEWHYKQIAFPYDTIPMHIYATEIEREIHKINSQLRKTDSEIIWSPIGPTGIINPSWSSHWGVSSGRVRAVAVHPTDPLTVYIGAASGGIWKTNDGGDNWSDIGSNVNKMLTFGAIAIDSNNPNVIYSGTD
jgi:hypothetical protein